MTMLGKLKDPFTAVVSMCDVSLLVTVSCFDVLGAHPVDNPRAAALAL